MPYKNREEQLAAQRRAYQRRKGYYQSQHKDRKQEIRDWFSELKRKYCCLNCGESHPACIDFHHRNPEEKDREVSEVSWHGFGKERILAEIAKCDPLCANCHRKLHCDGA